MVERFVQFTAIISSIYKSIQKIERQEMERFGLRGPHVQCLVAVSRHPEGIAAARLCEICEKDKASVSRSVAALEEKGLLRRESGYRGKLTLTRQGQEVTASICLTAQKCVEAVSLDFDEEQRAAFYNALERIAGNLQNMYAEGVSEI